MGGKHACGTGRKRRSVRDREARLNKRLAAYSLAAGATALVGTETGEAMIIVNDLDPDVSIGLDPGDATEFYIDFNGGGDDIGLRLASSYSLYNNLAGFALDQVVARTFAGVARNGTAADYYYAARPFEFNQTIGPEMNFGSTGAAAYQQWQANGDYFYANGSIQGGWADGQPHFIGVTFQDGENDHLGWIRVTVQENESFMQMIIDSYAYETMPGQPIKAGHIPEPTTLGLLATGAAGVLLTRRRRRKA